MTEELKPCPFCGPGGSVVSIYFDDSSRRYRVGCGACGCATGIHPRDKTPAPAIAAWNNRAPPFVTDEMIKRAAVAISGAPFPSKRSMDKARAVLAALGGS